LALETADRVLDRIRRAEQQGLAGESKNRRWGRPFRSCLTGRTVVRGRTLRVPVAPALGLTLGPRSGWPDARAAHAQLIQLPPLALADRTDRASGQEGA